MLMLPLATMPTFAADDENKEESKEDTSKTVKAQHGTYWILNMAGSPAGNICVRLSEITSVSIHNYMLNGKIPIAELTIDTTGNNSIRIYSVLSGEDMSKEILSLVSQLKSEASSLGSTPQVAKQFPEGTHSHSIEYSVSDASKLKGIYNSITKAMMSNKSTKLSITP